MTTLHRWAKWCALCLLFLAVAVLSPAQTFTSLHSFKGPDGANPYTSFAQGPNGILYGTTIDGGPDGSGSIFAMDTFGDVLPLWNFCSNCSDGQFPVAPLVLAPDGYLYGTTQSGGTNGGFGTIFKISPTGGPLITLHSFSAIDGASPYSSLLPATDGNLYGTTNGGGVNNVGTIFKVTTTGQLTTLYNFCSAVNCGDGQFPVGPLIQGTDGNIYGTTHAGGNTLCQNGCGTIFRITPGGSYTTLHRFNKSDGDYPYGGVVEGLNGELYGTTGSGGANQAGSVFTLSPNGTLTTIHSFDGAGGGASPYAMSLGSDSNFYGTTSAGGIYGVYGTIFEITPDGTFTTLHSFDIKDGAVPYTGLLQSTTGLFYGTTYFGGGFNDGTVFNLNSELDPFVAFVVPAGRVGQSGGILGQGFRGTTSVTINSLQMEFTAVSDTFLRATIPVGATSGYVKVTTPGGTLTSNVPLRVIR